jgi:hypothetical protein
VVYFGGFFAKLEFSRGFIYLSLILPFIFVSLPSVCLICMYVTISLKRREEYEDKEEEEYSTVEKNMKIYEEKKKKNKTKKVRTYGRTPNESKKAYSPSKNPSE